MLPRGNTNDSQSQNSQGEGLRDSRTGAFKNIESLVSTPSSNAANPQIAISLMKSFSEELKKNDASFLENLSDEMRDLFKKLTSEISKIQDKSVEKTTESLTDLLERLEEISLKAGLEGDTKTQQTANNLKEAVFQDMFKQQGIDKDRTVGERLGIPDIKEGYQNFKAKMQNSEGIKEKLKTVGSTIKESTSPGIAAFSQGFRKQFAGGLFYSDREKREDLRNQVEKENYSMARSKVLGEQVEGLFDAKPNVGLPAISDTEESATANRDVDSDYLRSGLDYDPKDNWEKLLKILEEMKECICDCDRCDSNNQDPNRMPIPIPIPSRTGVRTPVAIPTGVRTPVAIPTSVRTPIALPAPNVRTPLALPAPAGVRTSSSTPRALPAPGLGDPTLESLGMRDRERVRVRGAAAAAEQPRTIAQRHLAGEISSEEAARQMREQNRANRGTGARPSPNAPASTVANSGARGTGTAVARPGARTPVAPRGRMGLASKALGVFGVGMDIFDRASSGQSVGRIATGVTGGVAGGMLGAQAGAALGTLGGPFAPITVPLGGFIGGALGYFGGSVAGDAVYDTVNPEPTQGALPAPTQGALPAPTQRALPAPASRPGILSRVGSGAGRILSGAASGAGRLMGGAGRVLGTAGRAAASALPNVASKAGSLLGGAARVAGKFAAPLAIGMAAYDGFKGFNADPNASMGSKLLNAGSSALNGLSFGLLGSSADEIAAESAAKPQIESGRNMDSAALSSLRSRGSDNKQPIINVPPPTVIQSGGGMNPVISTPRSPRPEDNTWLAWQKTRASFTA